jgi:beta-phosphoglucomutase family hydrolase
MNPKKIAVIFDMDGVLVDNLLYHFDAWKQFSAAHAYQLTDEELTNYVNGRVSKEILEYLFKRELNPEEVHRYTEEKEELYRSLYRPHLKPTEGLISFLENLKQHQVPIAVGTSAPATNIDFTLINAGIKDYFQTIVDARDVKKGKPAPEIYLKAARLLGMEPANCVVIEDALLGIEAAKRAGMKVIGIATTHKAEEITHTDLVIQDFHELSYERVVTLLEK